MSLSLLIPLPEQDCQGLEQETLPCQLSGSVGMSLHPLTNARGLLALEMWYYSGRHWAETEGWWKTRSYGTVRAMLSLSIRDLRLQSARHGQSCRGVRHGYCPVVTWSSPSDYFCPMDSAHHPQSPSALISASSMVWHDLLTVREGTGIQAVHMLI